MLWLYHASETGYDKRNDFMKKINILHISDLHATKNSISSMSSIVSSLSEDVSILLAGEHIDIVAFTGDIVHSG